MHDCRETKEQITELLLDGADRSHEVLSAALRGCADCRNEFEALNATLRITTRSRELSAPTEDYWTSYHAKLRQKLSHVNAPRESHGPSLVARFFRFSIPVPAPVAVALIVACAILVPLGIRAARKQTARPSVVHVPVEVRVEVPVIRQKVVTRVVYRDRRTSKQTGNAEPKVENTFAKFKPTDEVKLTVIKGGSGNEK
ncbi:MAG TPA: hypothetical protein VJ656_07830 [Pyrinomonadaceae bacterium]|nr:hypothetical protein [Pyrinomonadaceae bacterium]